MRGRSIIQGVVPRQPLLCQFSAVEADIPHHPRHDVVVENVRRRADRRPLHRERKLSKHGRGDAWTRRCCCTYLRNVHRARVARLGEETSHTHLVVVHDVAPEVLPDR